MENKPKGFFDGSPLMIFVFGLVTGIALMSLFGGGITLPKIGGGNSGSNVVRTFDNDDTAPLPGTTAPAGELAAVTGDEHIKGGSLEDAKVVLVEYSDFECPFCVRHHPSMQQLLDEFGDDVAWVYRHFPLSFHPLAEPAGQASECAAEQGEFWAFGDTLFEYNAQFTEQTFFDIAEDIGLNVNQFTDCYESGKYADAVAEDYQSGVDAGVTGTPATFINGQLVSGAVPYETMAEIVQSIIDQS